MRAYKKPRVEGPRQGGTPPPGGAQPAAAATYVPMLGQPAAAAQVRLCSENVPRWLCRTLLLPPAFRTRSSHDTCNPGIQHCTTCVKVLPVQQTPPS